MNRREFLSLGAAAALGVFPVKSAFARDGGQLLRLMDGAVEAPKNLLQINEKQTAAIRAANFAVDVSLSLPVGVFLLKTGDKNILFDTGGGSMMQTLGKLPASLKANGISPERIDRIILTHMHMDHIGGLIDEKGQAVFPHAEVLVSEREYNFWRSADSREHAPEFMQINFDLAASVIRIYGERLKRFSGDTDLGDGIVSIALNGHTPGHSGYIVETDKESVFIAGDFLHVPSHQFAHPEWSSLFDFIPEAAANARRRVLEKAASERLTLAAMHLPGSGFGKVVRQGEGFAFVPV